MYVNFLTLSLLTVTAVFLVGAWYVLRGEARAQHREAYAFAFGAGGLLMTVTGLDIALTWPLPGPYNIAFGEPLSYFGILLVLGSVALRRGVALGPLSTFAAIGGAGTVIVGVAIARYRLTQVPALAAVVFVASGLGALGFPFRALSKPVRIAVFALLLLAGVLFALIGANAFLHHLAPGSFDAWKPVPMRGVMGG